MPSRTKRDLEGRHDARADALARYRENASPSPRELRQTWLRLEQSLANGDGLGIEDDLETSTGHVRPTLVRALMLASAVAAVVALGWWGSLGLDGGEATGKPAVNAAALELDRTPDGGTARASVPAVRTTRSSIDAAAEPATEPPMVTEPPKPSRPVLAPVPPPPTRSASRSRRRHASSTVQEESPRASVHPGEELSLLLQGKRALDRGDSKAAAEALAEHGRRFPDAPLAEEREVLVLELGCRSGRSDIVKRAAAFLEEHPQSLYRERVERLLGCAAAPQSDRGH